MNHRRKYLETSFILVLGIYLLGCVEQTDERKLIPGDPVTISELQSADNEGREVSITGSTIEPEGGTVVPITDGTGTIDVILPESLHIHTGARLSVQGILRYNDTIPVLMAEQWLYDSSRVPVHSP